MGGPKLPRPLRRAACAFSISDGSSGTALSSLPPFLQYEIENRNFVANIPDDIPGVLESITSRTRSTISG
jgi:hypothetical protein